MLYVCDVTTHSLLLNHLCSFQMMVFSDFVLLFLLACNRYRKIIANFPFAHNKKNSIVLM